MCGIVGFIDKEKKLRDNNYSGLLSSLYRRGPDNQSYLQKEGAFGKVFLGHSRLKVIDLSDNANQPLTNKSDGNTIVFNGEIYNYKKLREQCIEKGAEFTTDSDTEVILKLYQFHGIAETIKLLDGMFAFAIFNESTGHITLGRDRFGQKPLYFGVQNNIFSFSSDIRTFSQLFSTLSINEEALGCFFSEMATPRHQSIWNEVKKVPAGHYLIYDGNTIDSFKYWEPHFSSEEKHKEINLDTTESLITKAITKRLVADVPIGTFLSGGVDSSLITAIAANESGSKINTFSVGFEYEKYNELPYANVIAKKYNTNHHEIVVNPNNFDVVDDLINESGEPFADSSIIPTAFVSKFAKDNVTVALGGDGGDELFCGYPTYNQAQLMTKRQKIKPLKKLVNLGSKIVNHPAINNLNELLNQSEISSAKSLFRNMGFNNKEMASLFSKESIIKAQFKNSMEIIEESKNYTNNLFDSIWYSTLQSRLVSDYLVKVDRASMFHSLEVRSPFLDKDLFLHAIKHTPDQLLKNGVNKYILKKVAEKFIPNEILYRSKMGFAIPIGEWFRNDLKNSFIDTVINNKQSKIDINYSFIENLFNKHLNGEDHTNKLWVLFVFHKWIRMWENDFNLEKFY